MQDIEQYFAADQSGGAAECAKNGPGAKTADGLSPLADAQRLDRGQEGADEQSDDNSLDCVPDPVGADAGHRFLHAPGCEAAEASRGGVKQEFFARKIACHSASRAKALRAAARGSSRPRSRYRVIEMNRRQK